MARFHLYMVLIVGMMILFNVAGLATTTGAFLGSMGIGSASDLVNWQNTPLWIKIYGAFMLLAVTGIVIGTWKSSSPEMGISAGIASAVLFVFIGDLISIVTYANQNNVDPVSGVFGTIIYLIMTPLIIDYILSLYDWVRQHD